MSKSKQLSEQQIAKNEWIMEGFRKDKGMIIKACYKEVYPMVAKLIINNGGTKTDARSVLHDSLMVFRRKCQDPDFKLTAKFSTFLYSICRLRWQGQWHNRKKKVQEYTEILTDTDVEEVKEVSPYIADQKIENKIHNRLLIKWVYELMEKVNPVCGKILKLYTAGKSHREIAQLFQVTENTSRKKLNHCRIQLAKKIEDSPHFQELLSDSTTKSFLRKYLKHLLWLVFFI